MSLWNLVTQVVQADFYIELSHLQGFYQASFQAELSSFNRKGCACPMVWDVAGGARLLGVRGFMTSEVKASRCEELEFGGRLLESHTLTGLD